MNLQPGLSDFGLDGAEHPQLEKVKTHFVDDTQERDLPGFAIYAQFDLMCRFISDTTVQTVLHAPPLVEFGSAVAFQSAPHQQFIESIEPSESAGVCQRNEGGMDRSADGRIPADRFSAERGLPEPHATSGKHIEGQDSIVDMYHIHAVTQPTLETLFVDPVTLCGTPDELRGHLDLLDIRTICPIGQGPACVGHLIAYSHGQG